MPPAVREILSSLKTNWSPLGGLSFSLPSVSMDTNAQVPWSLSRSALAASLAGSAMAKPAVMRTSPHARMTRLLLPPFDPLDQPPLPVPPGEVLRGEPIRVAGGQVGPVRDQQGQGRRPGVPLGREVGGRPSAGAAGVHGRPAG